MCLKECTALWIVMDTLGMLTRTVRKPQFAFGYPFKDGKAKVTDTGERKEVPGSDGEYWYWESDEWYYIDKSGDRIE